jgi:uncharacterized protein (DUF433 family)
MTGQTMVAWRERQHVHGQVEPTPADDDSRWRSAACNAPYISAPEQEYNVSRSPDTWRGSAVLTGTAIPVFMVVDLYEEANKVSDVQENYPWLAALDILRAVAYAADYPELVAEDRARHEQAIREVFGTDR